MINRNTTVSTVSDSETVKPCIHKGRNSPKQYIRNFASRGGVSLKFRENCYELSLSLFFNGLTVSLTVPGRCNCFGVYLKEF